MDLQSLSDELLKFSAEDAPAVKRLGEFMALRMQPSFEQVYEAVFTLERFAQDYPAYSEIYNTLKDAINEQFAAVLQNPGVIQMFPGSAPEAEPALVIDEYTGPLDGDVEGEGVEAGSVKIVQRSPDGMIGKADFRGEGMFFDLGTCDHSHLPDREAKRLLQAEEKLLEGGRPTKANPHDADFENDLFTQVLLESQGPIMPPWVTYAETFNTFEAPPPTGTVQQVDFGAEYEQEERLAANPSRRKSESAQVWEMLKLKRNNLLSSNPKLAKGGSKCWMAAGFFLAPYSVAHLGNLCPFASKGCAVACLNTAGQGKMSAVQLCRIKRTKLIMRHRRAFPELFEKAITWWASQAERPATQWDSGMLQQLGMSPGSKYYKKHPDELVRDLAAQAALCPQSNFCFRPNNTSDIAWEGLRFKWPGLEDKLNIFERFAGLKVFEHQLQMYDYTKNPFRMWKFLNGRMPGNYYLTFSFSEANADVAFEVLDHGGNVAVVFDTFQFHGRHVNLPDMWCGYPVIDADVHDLRWLDNTENAEVRQKHGNKGLVCGLRLKGDKQKAGMKQYRAQLRAQGVAVGTPRTGFVQFAADCGFDEEGRQVGKNYTNDPGYKDQLARLAIAEREAQEREGYVKAQRVPIWR